MLRKFMKKGKRFLVLVSWIILGALPIQSYASVNRASTQIVDPSNNGVELVAGSMGSPSDSVSGDPGDGDDKSLGLRRSFDLHSKCPGPNCRPFVVIFCGIVEIPSFPGFWLPGKKEGMTGCW